MYILKNALKSITRSKARNILIGFILVIISISSCIALSIKNSAAEIVTSYKESFNLTATIGIDREALRTLADTKGMDIRELIQTIKNPTIDDIKKYGQSDYLTGYSYILSSSINSSNLTPLSNETVTPTKSETQNNSSGNNGGNNNGGPTGGFDNRQFSRGDFDIIGYSGVSAMTNFVNGTYKITQGAMFEDVDKTAVCVISEDLANDNNVKVGDTIKLSNPKNSTESFDFKIVGLYKDTSATDTSSMNWFSNSANQIIANYTALSTMVDTIKTASDKAIEQAAAGTTVDSTQLNAQLSSVFNLKDSASVTQFTAQLKEKGLSDTFTVTTNLDGLDQSLKPVNNLNNFATIFLILVLIIGGLILSVLNMINIRERKYEVGVLRAIGMKKGKLVLQFVTELLIVTFISIIIGSAVGASLSVPTASTLLKNEITSMQNSQNQIAENFGRPGGGNGMNFGNRAPRGIMGGIFNQGGNVNYITQINAVINFKVLVQLLLLGLALTIISSIVSIILISRYEPLKILSNRS